MTNGTDTTLLHLHLTRSSTNSSLTSPRSSTSSGSAHIPPLTPLLESDKVVSDEMVIASSSGSSDITEEDDLRFGGEDKPETPTDVIKMLEPLSISISTRPVPQPLSPEEEEGPTAGFSFGSCPSQPSIPLKSTPTHELGPFDYPSTSTSGFPTQYSQYSPPHNPTRRESFALGQTHRRASIVSRPPSTYSQSRRPSIPSPPATRRSSTCSTITTLPIAGRRPSILHSASTNSGPPPPMLPYSPIASPVQSRRSSLLFPQKAQATPIPPSLLARRGSLPAASLFGSNDMQATGRSRSSFAGSSSGAAGGSGVFTTAQLYNRRESIISDGGISSGSSTQTITPSGNHDPSSSSSSSSSSLPFLNQPSRRSSLRNSVYLDSEHQPYRRGSMPTQYSPSRVTFSKNALSPTSSRNNSLTSTQPLTSAVRNRHSSSSTVKSGLSGPSLSSSEEEEEEEEDELLPTPGMGGEEGKSLMMGFTDPWAGAGAGVGSGAASGGYRGNVAAVFGGDGSAGKLVRPVLESIPSDETERAG